ncbi:unnamed protein product [Meloidogyne enterolobii]|uniref:Uncharacterized protein n=1 Tax=Meloidogyne enterolobii TaxID=390850 RepID=A0ACB1A0C2_MELEN
MQGNQASLVKMTFEEVGRMPELKENPFRRRICEVFSEDGCGNLTFDDFLDMFSVFSEMAPLQLKLKYAFRIYDFDGDEFLGREDLRQMIDALTRKEVEQIFRLKNFIYKPIENDLEMSDEEVEFIIDRIIEEADLDGDKRISQAEFEHVVSRSPDFVRTFHIRI